MVVWPGTRSNLARLALAVRVAPHVFHGRCLPFKGQGHLSRFAGHIALSGEEVRNEDDSTSASRSSGSGTPSKLKPPLSATFRLAKGRRKRAAAFPAFRMEILMGTTSSALSPGAIGASSRPTACAISFLETISA